MRILVISDLPQFVTGGAEIQASRLIQAWLEAGHEVRCLGRRIEGKTVQLGGYSLPVRRIRTANRFGRLVRAATYFLSLCWLLVRHRKWADVVYVRFLGEAATTVALLKATRFLTAPLVVTPANTGGAGDIDFINRSPFSERVIRLLDRHCDAINLIADHMIPELLRAGFTGHNFSRIPNGMPVSPATARHGDGPARLVAVGRMTRQKGYDILLEAMTRVMPLLTPGQVNLVGDGPERSALEQLAGELGVAKALHWHGGLPQNEVSELLDQCDLFLLPSRYEGMSNAGLEAMERGMPVLLTMCGGLDRHVTPDMGWVVPVDDVDAFARALGDVLLRKRGELHAMGAAARRYLQETFEIRSVSSRYLALFDRLLAARESG